MKWQEVKNDTDVNCINELYNYFEDAILVKMEYVSGDYVDSEMVGHMEQTNDLKVLFQRLDCNPFSIELWFTNTKRMKCSFITHNKSICQTYYMQMYAEINSPYFGRFGRNLTRIMRNICNIVIYILLKHMD